MKWTPAAIRKLRRLYPTHTAPALAKALGRTRASVDNMAHKLKLRKPEAFLRSPACRFQPGMVPWNRGVTGYMGANRTSFRCGQMPHNHRPIGSIRITKDGTRQRKVSDTGYPPRDWKAVHALLWEKHRGRIPRGHIVVFKDRDSTHIRLSNLELITRAENMRRNTYHRYPKEIALAIQLRGALQRQINKREGKHEHHRGTA